MKNYKFCLKLGYSQRVIKRFVINFSLGYVSLGWGGGGGVITFNVKLSL